MSRPATRATYRLQLREGVTLDDAVALVDDLVDLGVSHLYLSPVLQATAGSTHGYDVVDPGRVDHALGGDEAFTRLCRAAQERGLGVVVDIVPNHLAALDPANRAWWDLLAHGPHAEHAAWFDVDWDPPEPRLRGRLLLPVLEDHYGRLLEAGAFGLERVGAELRLAYHQLRFPLAPGSQATVLAPAAEAVGSEQLAFVARGLARVDAPVATPEARREDLAVLNDLLTELLHDPDLAAAVDAEAARVSADPDALDALLDAQHYRLARWRTAAEEHVYRRFFDVNSLIGVRVEDADVFAATHVRLRSWLDDGLVDGIRVDHPDGLRRPAEYLRRLRDLAPDRWIVVEKILARDEELPAWPVDGTTGYDALAVLTGLFVDPEGQRAMEATAAVLTGVDQPFGEVAHDAEVEVLTTGFGAEVRRVAQGLVEVCEQHRRFRDFSRREIEAALVAFVVAMPVYRTYVTETGTAPTPADRAAVEAAVTGARAARPDLDGELLDLLAGVVLGGDGLRGPAVDDARMRIQQLSAPAEAKGVEDTALYRYPALAAVNEVGIDPGHAVVDPADLHAWCRRTLDRWPTTMTALSTHDTKRSEDVRARLLVLSEVPGVWDATVRRWLADNRPLRRGDFDDPSLELLLYQAMVGAHPLPPDRLRDHALKAAREAKRFTSWTDPDEAAEADLLAFLDALGTDDRFQGELAELVDRIRRPGRVNALAQKLVQLTMPGVPDLYQGTEAWALSLVDPDNRRPIDHAAMAALRARAAAADGKELAASLDDPDDPGLAKVAVVRAALDLRRRHPEAFLADGIYEPLWPTGPGADRAVAFVRGHRRDRAVTVVPRLVATVGTDTLAATTVTLPKGRWVDAFDPDRRLEREVTLADLWDPLPVALLVRDR
ncbi:MAG: malto-oligosyltrehalose synthase [Acidimicrobiales bacterium]